MDGNILKQYRIWFITGSQHLYGPETLRRVDADSRAIVDTLNRSGEIAPEIVWKPVVTTPPEISATLRAADADPSCAGVICWMHTFSPAKMWIHGLKLLRKPMLHWNTQANRDIPWAAINMDFMNLNQAAHGDREFGYICTRLGIRRRVLNGPGESPRVRETIDRWTRVAAAWLDAQTMKVARIGDNMRGVAVTEGNKVDAQIRLGYAVDGFGAGDVTDYVAQVSDAEAGRLTEEYFDLYTVPDRSAAALRSIRAAARQEIGIRTFLEAGGYTAFTTTFEDLHGFDQLPGLAAQRLMADGYGFGAEGDWKTAALLRTMKLMAAGRPGGVSFMEDYTYHFEPGRERVLGAHMLEVCPSIAAGKPSLEVHPLGIGGKADPARLVFSAAPGPAINATMVELGAEFRLVVNEVEVVAPDAPLPKLPVASSVWIPRPDLARSAERWIEAGGAHHSVNAPALTVEFLEDYAGIAGVELVAIR